MVIPRSRNRAAMRMASSSEVVVREVAKRKCSASSSPRNMPRWVWVLPTSIAMSTGKLSAGSKGSEAGDALVGNLRQGRLQELWMRRVQLQQRLQHEAAVHQLRVWNPQLGRPMLAAIDQQQVDVDRPRRVPGRVRV